MTGSTDDTTMHNMLEKCTKMLIHILPTCIAPRVDGNLTFFDVLPRFSCYMLTDSVRLLAWLK